MRQSTAAIALIVREVDGQTQWLVQWNHRWQAYRFVGGHKRHDESFRECMIREIGEELRLEPERDVLVSAAPTRHLQYVDVSQPTGDQTSYTIELFDVALVGDGVLDRIAVNPENCWLTEEEIMAGRALEDGRPVSRAPKRFLVELGLDLFVGYAHADDHDGWVTELLRAIRAEHAEFSPVPLRVFFDRQDIRTMDDWQLRIYDALHSSRLMLAVLSTDYFASPYCRKEWEIYVAHETARQMQGEAIAPIYIVTVPDFEAADEAELDRWRVDLRRRQFEDIRRWRPHGAAALRELDVRQRLRSPD